MSRIPAESLSYAAAVGEYYLQLRGAGLLLSPLDQELVAEWERRGLPVPVVCRGLRAGWDALAASRAATAGPPRSIRALRGYVEEEWRAYRHGRVGDSASPGGEAEAAAARLSAARERLADAERSAPPPRRAPYRAAALRLPAGAPSLREVEWAFREADDELLRAWLASLERPERCSLGPRCRLLAGPRSRGARPAAYRETLRSHLFDAARRAGILCLHGTV